MGTRVGLHWVSQHPDLGQNFVCPENLVELPATFCRLGWSFSSKVAASLQNVAGFDKILSGQISQIGAEIGAGLRNVGAETGKPGAEVEKMGQKCFAQLLTTSHINITLDYSHY